MTDTVPAPQTAAGMPTSVVPPLPQGPPAPPHPQAPAPQTIPPLEGVKMAVDFVKQLLTLSSGLIPIISGGIFALRQNNIHIPRAWYYAVVALLVSMVIGMLSFGSFIGQIERDRLSTRDGKAPAFARAQILLFLVALVCIVYGAALSATKLH